MLAHWKKVVQDFSRVEPLIGAYLDGTELRRDNEEAVAAFTIIFQSGQSFALEQFRRNDNYKAALEQYMETILGYPALLDFACQTPSGESASEMPQSPQTPRHKNFIFEQDMQNEPILRVLQDIFETRYISSRSVRSRPPLSQESL